MEESNKSGIQATPMVTIWMTAYNHASYIAQAIESVLMQKTDFDFNIVIGEDYSTDNTRSIVLEYKEKYPEKIITHLPPVNLGMIQMVLESYKLCSGKYIAWLDGDDYWTDPFKLQKQVIFLEENAGFVMAFHSVKYHDLFHHNSYTYCPPAGMAADNSLGMKDFFSNNPVVALSVVHRNVLGASLPEWFGRLPFPDLAFHFLLLRHGRAKYLGDEMGVYRILKDGAWSGVSDYEKQVQLASFYRKIGKYLGLKKDRLFQECAYPFFIRVLEESIPLERSKNVIIYYFYLLRNYPEFRLKELSLNQQAMNYLYKVLPKKILPAIIRKF